MTIRDATPADAGAITAIYNAAVTDTTAVWNTTPVDVADRRAWIADRVERGFPVMVAVDADGSVAGYASFGDWRAWDGYRHTVEHSVHVRADRRGGGIGGALLAALIERARASGRHVMIAAVEAGNAGSIRLHRRLGFESGPVMRQVGAKFGRWLDLVFLQLRLDTRSGPD